MSVLYIDRKDFKDSDGTIKGYAKACFKENIRCILRTWTSFLVSGDTKEERAKLFMLPAVDRAIKNERNIVFVSNFDNIYDENGNIDKKNFKKEYNSEKLNKYNLVDRLKSNDYEIVFINLSKKEDLTTPYLRDISTDFTEKERELKLCTMNTIFETQLKHKNIDDSVSVLLRGVTSASPSRMLLVKQYVESVKEAHKDEEQFDVHNIIDDKIAYIINSNNIDKKDVGFYNNSIYLENLLVVIYTVCKCNKIKNGMSFVLDETHLLDSIFKGLKFGEFNNNKDMEIILSSDKNIVDLDIPAVHLGKITDTKYANTCS